MSSTESKIWCPVDKRYITQYGCSLSACDHFNYALLYCDHPERKPDSQPQNSIYCPITDMHIPTGVCTDRPCTFAPTELRPFCRNPKSYNNPIGLEVYENMVYCEKEQTDNFAVRCKGCPFQGRVDFKDRKPCKIQCFF